MFSSDRNAMRKVFFDAWQKYQTKSALEPLEAQLLDIILLHPEYHSFLNDPDHYQNYDFGDSNPFLHLSLHLAIREQINTNRPTGITVIYETLCRRFQDPHVAEHTMLECLAQLLWDAQQSGKMADESVYLARLQKL